MDAILKTTKLLYLRNGMTDWHKILAQRNILALWTLNDR